MIKSPNELNEICNEISKKINNGLPIYGDSRGNLDNPPTMSRRHNKMEYTNKLKSRLHQIIKFSVFLSSDDINNIYENLEEITNLIDVLNNSPIIDVKQRDQTENKLYDLINKIPEVENLPFNYSNNINPKQLFELIKTIKSKNKVFNKLNIEEIISNSKVSEIERIINKFILIHNGYKNNSDNQIILGEIIEAYKILEDISNRVNNEKISKSIEESQDQLLQIREYVGVSENSDLFEAFKTKAESFSWKIIIYNIFILMLFTIIISGLFLLVFLMIFNKDFNYIQEIQFYGAYISLFLFLSGLITYLIKERTRLLKYQHYCQITYLELAAIIPYTNGIKDTNKAEDLKIHLADRYFQGPNQGPNSTSTGSEDVSISKLNEIIKILQDVKSFK